MDHIDDDAQRCTSSITQAYIIKMAKKASSAVFHSASSSMRALSSKSSSSVSNDFEESDSIDGEFDSSDEKPKPAKSMRLQRPKRRSSKITREGKLMKVVCLRQSNGSFKMDGETIRFFFDRLH